MKGETAADGERLTHPKITFTLYNITIHVSQAWSVLNKETLLTGQKMEAHIKCEINDLTDYKLLGNQDASLAIIAQIGHR